MYSSDVRCLYSLIVRVQVTELSNNRFINNQYQHILIRIRAQDLRTYLDYEMKSELYTYYEAGDLKSIAQMRGSMRHGTFTLFA